MMRYKSDEVDKFDEEMKYKTIDVVCEFFGFIGLLTSFGILVLLYIL